MNIQMIGIDHTKAPIDVRSVFSFTKTKSAEAMELLHREAGISGCVLLSTCNRMELYISATDEWAGDLVDWLCRYRDVDRDCFESYFERRTGEQTARHLFFLASGLRSQILGEDQIITQVKDALTLARESNTADGMLEVLFRMAVTAGKQVKTEVVFPKGSQSAVERAVTHLEREGYEIRGRRCLVIGNGQMGQLAARAFRDAGADVTMTVRQYHHKQVELPDRCSSIEYDSRLQEIPKCSFVVSATSSPHYTITREMIVQTEMQEGLVMIDLAVPRDLEESIQELETVTLFDIDDFKSDTVEPDMRKAWEKAEQIIEDKLAEFNTWVQGRTVLPHIEMIREEAAQDMMLRLKKQIRKLPLDEREREHLTSGIERTAEKVVNKMLFGLRDSLTQEQFDACIGSLEALYEE